MKNYIKAIAIVILGILIISAMSGLVTIDKRDAKVVELDDSIVVFETIDGNQWEWEQEPNKSYAVGQEVKLTFFDGGDTNIYNDIIEKVENK